MYDSTGQVLGAATAGVILPATASAMTGVNYFYCLAAFASILVAYNVIIKIASKFVK